MLTREAVNAVRARREQERRAMRQHLLPWVRHWVPGYQTSRFHRYLAANLERFMVQVETGQRPRMMLFVPPAHGKTEMTTRGAASWMLGHHPEWRLLAATYNQTLANEFGSEVRRRVTSPEFARVFPKASRLIYNHTNNAITFGNGGTYNALGIGAAGGGRHANVLLIDDPVKTRADAESEVMRQKVVDWYSGTARNRLLPGAGVLVIQTRWHVDDLSGHLLQVAADDPLADQWDVVSFPAVALEDDVLGRSIGDPLCPERYDLEELRAVQHSCLERDWLSLFQQQPFIAGGNLIRLHWIRDLEPGRREDCDRVWQAWDLATTDKGRKHGDKSACVTFGRRRSDGQFVWLDCYVCKVEAPVVADEVIRLYRKWQPRMVFLENNGPGASLRGVLRERLNALGISLPHEFITVTHTGDKVARSVSFRDALQLGMVEVDKAAPWWPEASGELALFPDQTGSPNIVDACSLLFMQLQRMRHGDGDVRDSSNTGTPGVYDGAAAVRARLAGRRSLLDYTTW